MSKLISFCIRYRKPAAVFLIFTANLLLLTALFEVLVPPAVPASAVDCCYHECRQGSQSSNDVYFCGPCDRDNFQKWMMHDTCSNATTTCTGTGCTPPTTTCTDGDNDGYGNPASGACTHPEVDCDDSRSFIYPGAVENCDGFDNNCQGGADEACDADRDRHCSSVIQIYNSNAMCPDTPFTGNGMTGDDCNDNNANVFAGRSELCNDAIDNNCDGVIDCADPACSSAPACCVTSWQCTAWSATCTLGNRTRTCTDLNNCGSTSGQPALTTPCLTATIVQPSPGTVLVQGNSLSFSGTAAGGTGTLNYEWIFQGTSQLLFSNSQSGATNNTLGWDTGSRTIALVISDATGQHATATVGISVYPAGTFTVDLQTAQYTYVRNQPGATANFFASIFGGSAPFSYSWNVSGVGTIPQNVQNPSMDVSSWSAGNHTVTVTVTDSAGNTATDSVTITIMDFSINPQPANGTTQQQGFDVYFSANPSGGSGAVSCTWTDNGSPLSTTCNFTRDNLSIGSHAITINARDSSSPPATVTMTLNLTITAQDPFTITISQPAGPSYFVGASVPFSATVSGGVFPYAFYEWRSSINGVLQSASQNFNPADTPAVLSFSRSTLSEGTHTITLRVRDSKNNERTQTVSITINPIPPLAAQITSPASGGSFEQTADNIQFTGSASGGTGPYTYSWSSSIDGNLSNQASFSRNNLALGSHTVTLTINDSAGHSAQAQVSFTVTPLLSNTNVKDLARYAARETFLISDSSWREVLGLVPVAVWKDAGTNAIIAHPALIYHRETNNFDADSTIHFMQLFQTGHVTQIGAVPAGLSNLLLAAAPTGAGLQASAINTVAAANYTNYWSSWNTAVVSSYDSYENGLMASVFASQINAPIFFLNATNLAAYQVILNGKNVYSVGTLDPAVTAYLNGNGGVHTNYSMNELIDLYHQRSANNSMIITNSNDLTFSINRNLSTKGPSSVSLLFRSLSLTSPFLASKNNSIILLINSSDVGANSNCTQNNLLNTNYNNINNTLRNYLALYDPNSAGNLTIIGSPRLIPDSILTGCSGASQLREQVDWRYGSIDDNINSAKTLTGRLYGLTVSDVSSNVAKSNFYSEIYNLNYTSPFRSMSIGLSSQNARNIAQEFRNILSTSGYNAVCFLDINGATCTNDSTPDFANYESNNIIAYHDGASFNNWGITISYSQFPFMKIPIIISESPQSNNFWQSDQGTNLISIFSIRQGAITYYGSVSSIDHLTRNYTVSKGIITSLGANQDNSLGDALYNIGNELLNFNMLGIPELKPRLQHITWP